MRHTYSFRRAVPFDRLRPAEKVLVETVLELRDAEPGGLSWRLIADYRLFEEFAHVLVGGGPDAWKRHLRGRRLRKAGLALFVIGSVLSGLIKPLLDGNEAARTAAVAITTVVVGLAFFIFVVLRSFGLSHIAFLFGFAYAAEVKRFAQRLRLIST